MIISAVSIVHVKIKLPHSFTFWYLDQHCQLRQILNLFKEFKSHLTVVCTWCMSDVHLRSFYSHAVNITPVLNIMYKTKHSVMAS